jgi:hypothetical protein
VVAIAHLRVPLPAVGRGPWQSLMAGLDMGNRTGEEQWTLIILSVQLFCTKTLRFTGIAKEGKQWPFCLHVDQLLPPTSILVFFLLF